MLHVDDWLDAPANDEAEKMAKEWIEHFRRPAIDKDYRWLRDNPLFCTYEGERFRCIGASRMGDVWITKRFERENGYDNRVDVADCSDWTKTPNVYKLSGTPAGRQRVCLSRGIRFYGLLGLFATGMLTDKWGEAANAVSGVRLNARFYGIESGANHFPQ